MRMSYKAGVLFFAAALFVAAPPARAEGAEDTEQTTRLMQFAANNSDFDKIVEDAAERNFKLQISDCAAPEKAVRQLPVQYGKIEFPYENANTFPPPVGGIWAEHVKVRGCGKVWDINMLAVAMPNKTPRLLALLPGNTQADPSVQRAAEKIAAVTIKKTTENVCADTPKSSYTKVIGYKQADGTVGSKNANAGWFEEWTFRYCQKTVPVQMAFIPNETGSYDIKARIVPSAQPKVPESKPVAGPAGRFATPTGAPAAQ